MENSLNAKVAKVAKIAKNSSLGLRRPWWKHLFGVGEEKH
jgi:hypothetical protein